MSTFLIPLDSRSRDPVYQQICEYLKVQIRKGRLKPGEKLPSARGMAQNLGVSRSTVDLAYGQLVSEGYIESLPCKGYYVCEIDGMYFPGEARKADEQEDTAKRERLAAGEKEDYETDFALDGIAPGGFPHNLWRKLARRALAEGEDQLYKPGDPCGEPGLREALAGYLYQARGVRCIPEQILVGAGNDYLLLLLGTILGSGRKMGMENPTYLSAYYDFRYTGFRIEAVGQDSQGMKTEDLEASGADTAYVMPSHQFPMGMVMPLKRRMELLAWAARGEERYIIEDDYDSEFRYKGKPVPALQGFDGNDCVIYMGTFSKSLAPSVRVSYMVLPVRLMQRYQNRGGLFAVTVSRADQKILELFLKEGNYERHLNRMRAVYKNKHDLMLRELKELGDIAEVSGENAGVHLLVRLKSGLSEQEAVQRAGKAGIRVYGLSEYQISRKKKIQESTVVLGYACLREEEIREAVRKLKKIWDIRENYE